MHGSNMKPKAKLHKVYPKSSLLIYNGTTFFHFLLGGIGIIIGYSFLSYSLIIGIIYLAFAFGEMYILMPFKVCPNCLYYRLEGSICVSGMNIVSRKVAKRGNPKDFPNRAKGRFSPNNLYMVSLNFPIVAIVPALIVNFSWILLLIFIVVIVLMMFRFFIIFMKVSCIHCLAKYSCPQAGQMGVRDM